MDLLRSKIFKRVKPKALNKRYITGASLLELCIAYTQAINKGSVPCIESAWTYVCQNENNRAIESAIMAYKKELKESLIDASLMTTGLLLLSFVGSKAGISKA